ncbi:30S ribosomal protein S13 [Candidatus Daviesbacteria bacterium RIFCSPHIGHO2_12_FULL_37_11]|uniref:Small ribosomal subunit protein uS13 n=1 Tax=Candidatus Daviesbacteria bacterium RIFCSPHIGHO2_12_FULL_37_11 TaxID=1797777 RepID=A0A1F5KCI9_9BACT|nr:MAG: 30S ribosomal protein S13 [Candidatus Daviesbacteria bacterium GWA1_38_6]OGE16449.1 MAG: 30S ribosomal protein S13 [Candidatus Daviesbacteria bacterium RIFCSPHIGHO2_01_FULL_37_27]OGE38544.1 MAG: 30S ribosomal protein S13 [Candidatus Daviesbacteria bacterium RIFCSPHIGHO2_12_FULL_37_11]OGE46139.1 MAG: 30S ribosomal protein S13 [Candidatus Daviesbacteria bacterium RIFCSPLOWO2_01_FULL_37_10]
MARIAGIDLPEAKRVDIGLTYIFGIGRSNVVKVLKDAGVDASKRIKDLTDDEVSKLQKSVDQFKVEGDLRGEIAANIKSLEDIGSYRGLRHRRGLPVRGQRTRSNARTRRGKRKTIGAISKETQGKTGGAPAQVAEDKKV